MSVQPSAAQYEAVIVQTAITMLNRIGISGAQAQKMWNPEAEETPIPRTYMEGYSDGKAWALEEAAKVCDEHAQLCEREHGQTTMFGGVRADNAKGLASEIRRLKEASK